MKKVTMILCLLSVAGIGSGYVYSSSGKNVPVVPVKNTANISSFAEITEYPIQQQPGKSQKSASAKKAVSKTPNKPGSTNAHPVASKQDIEQGQQLVGKSDCLACHKVEVKLVGPAYLDVAKKYPGTETNINMLAQKVIKGGTGVWGQIPMTPHPAIALADARNMVKYILSLNAK